MTLINNAHNSQLDMDPWVAQRVGTFRFDLVDGVTGQPLGEIHPLRNNPPTLSHDVTRTIKRTLTPLTLGVSDTASVNPVSDRVRVSMLVDGVTYPLGRYVFTDQTKITSTGGVMSTNTLVDEMFIVDQKIEVAFVPRNLQYSGALYNKETADQSIANLVRSLPVEFSGEPTPYGTTTSWAQGTNRGRIVDELAVAGDYLPVWFDNLGVMRAIRSFDPVTQVPDFDWDANNVVNRDSITQVSDLLSAPNRIIVVSNNIGQTSASWLPIVGVYNAPASAPYSLLNRGFLVTDVQGFPIATPTQATAIAQNIGRRASIFERTELSTPPDPRFDSHNVIRWQGSNWLELAWSLPLIEGGNMHHVMRKAYR